MSSNGLFVDTWLENLKDLVSKKDDPKSGYIADLQVTLGTADLRKLLGRLEDAQNARWSAEAALRSANERLTETQYGYSRHPHRPGVIRKDLCQDCDHFGAHEIHSPRASFVDETKVMLAREVLAQAVLGLDVIRNRGHLGSCAHETTVLERPVCDCGFTEAREAHLALLRVTRENP